MNNYLKFICKLFICSIFYCGTTSSIVAQTNCATDIMHDYLLENSSQYRQEIIDLEDRIITHQNIERRSTYTIPVVVHILHKGEAIGVGTNITETRVIEAIEGANSRWNDTNGPGPSMDIEFCLAKVDPNGNPTNGIVRVDASGVTDYLADGLILTYEGNSNEVELKNLSNWPHDKYYNIWVITKFNAGWGGYAYFPIGSNYTIDGTSIISTSMRGTSTLLSHELGHGMNLYHTFSGSNGSNCPSNSNCSTQGDRVCDTPPHTENQCSSTFCTTEGDLDRSFKNYMSYCSGINRFTPGQKTRVDAALLNTTRNDLLTAGTCNVLCDDVVQVNISDMTCDPTMVSVTIDTLPKYDGCDSIVIVTTTLLPTANSTFVITSCNPADEGVTVDTLYGQAVNGCDSIVVTSTTLIPQAEASFTYEINDLTVDFTNTSQDAESIEWFFGDGINENAVNNVSHTYVTATIYAAFLVATNQCGEDTVYATIDLSATGFEFAYQLDRINLSPNPNRGDFELQLNGKVTSNMLELTIYNLVGQEIERREIEFDGSASLNYKLSNISSGSYFIEMKSESKLLKTIPFSIID